MNLPAGRRGQLTAVALLAILVILAFRHLVWPAWEQIIQLDQAIDDAQFASQRYRQHSSLLPVLRQALAQLRAQRPLGEAVLQDDNPALAAASLQQRMQQLADSYSGRVISIRSLPVSTQDGLNRIPLQLHLQIPYSGLHRLLRQIEYQHPLTVVREFEVKQTRSRSTTGELDVHLVIEAYQADLAQEEGIPDV